MFAYLDPHENIVLLYPYVSHNSQRLPGWLPYLLVANRELPLGLLIFLREGLQLFDCLALQDRYAELDVRLSVFVTRLYGGRRLKSAPGHLILRRTG